MSTCIEICESAADEDDYARSGEWAAHCSALRTPELRSVLEQLQSRLKVFFRDAEQA